MQADLSEDSLTRRLIQNDRNEKTGMHQKVKKTQCQLCGKEFEAGIDDWVCTECEECEVNMRNEKCLSDCVGPDCEGCRKIQTEKPINSGYPLLADGWRETKKELPEMKRLQIQVEDIIFLYKDNIYHGSYHSNGYFYSCDEIGPCNKNDVFTWIYLCDITKPIAR
jgi:hypothetical protein